MAKRKKKSVRALNREIRALKKINDDYEKSLLEERNRNKHLKQDLLNVLDLHEAAFRKFYVAEYGPKLEEVAKAIEIIRLARRINGNAPLDPLKTKI